MSALMGPMTLTFDLLTSKVVRESHLRWGTFVPNVGTLGIRVLELFAMYATDGRTDGRTKATLNAPFPTGGGITITRSGTSTPNVARCVPSHCT